MDSRKRIVIVFAVALLLVFMFWPRRTSYMQKDYKIAYISAVIGSYEKTCKPYKEQSVPSDFIMFTDDEDISKNNNNWIVDTKSYVREFPSELDDGYKHNSLKNNKHTFNVAKYYKQSFHLIPRLNDYDIIIWIDGTIEIKDENFTKFIIEKFKNGYDLVSVNYNARKGILKNEVEASHFERYDSTFWNGQDQPFQDVDAQYQHYVNDGYNDDNSNVWITCLVAFNMRNEKTKRFLDLWYDQTLKFTTQDQLSFPYCVQKMNMSVFTIDENNNFFIKHSHGK